MRSLGLLLLGIVGGFLAGSVLHPAPPVAPTLVGTLADTLLTLLFPCGLWCALLLAVACACRALLVVWPREGLLPWLLPSLPTAPRTSALTDYHATALARARTTPPPLDYRPTITIDATSRQTRSPGAVGNAIDAGGLDVGYILDLARIGWTAPAIAAELHQPDRAGDVARLIERSIGTNLPQ